MAEDASGKAPINKNSVSNILNGRIEQLVSKKTAKQFLLDKGVEPMQCLIDVYVKASEAFDKLRGDNDFSHYGPQYLAIAAKMAETMSKYAYPTFKAIEQRVYEEQEDRHFKKAEHLKINPSQIRQVILDDPMAKAEKLYETSAERMDKALTSYAASLATGEKQVLGTSSLPIGESNDTE